MNLRKTIPTASICSPSAASIVPLFELPGCSEWGKRGVAVRGLVSVNSPSNLSSNDVGQDTPTEEPVGAHPARHPPRGPRCRCYTCLLRASMTYPHPTSFDERSVRDTGSPCPAGDKRVRYCFSPGHLLLTRHPMHHQERKPGLFALDASFVAS